MKENIKREDGVRQVTKASVLVVVIPTKNRRALLERALESAQSQKYDNYRIVIINDGSTDDTCAYLEGLHDERVNVIHNEKSGGVNAARNAALKTLTANEWAVQLDDDDMLLPGSLATIAEAIARTPEHIQILAFNAITRTSDGEYGSGMIFAEDETYFDPSYEEFMMGINTHGDTRVVFKWTLFPKYLFQEGINGFEGEWWLNAAHDNVGIRYLPEKTTLIDQVHGGEHLSNVSARRNPASYVLAYKRIFKTHAEFYVSHPQKAMHSALSAIKLSVRAGDVYSGLLFGFFYLQGFIRVSLGAKWFKK